VQAAALRGSDHRRATNVSARLDAQQKKLNLPVLPTTTIGSFPQTVELRRVRREYKAKKISEDEYVSAIKEEISKVVKIQEELDIDVLVHGEPEVSILVYYLCLVFITRLYTWLFEKTILLDLLTH
jgi:5-methyltetrahydropteroyltriglutamate--homocysteine methyltransferase